MDRPYHICPIGPEGVIPMKKYACLNCVFTITCEELPEDLECPICGSHAEEFVEVPA